MLHRQREALQVLIGHPGGPLWARRDRGAWSIPKGLVEPGEEPFDAALREFEEETGFAIPAAPPIPLGTVVQASRKRVSAWAIEGDADPDLLSSDLIEMVWPRGSGRHIRFPEIDRVVWAGVDEATVKLNQAQGELVRRLVAELGRQIPT
jgi:predicted NUDIX family NTP pyrophosphohydrolase